MPGGELDVLAFAGGSDVIDVGGLDPGLLEHLVVTGFRQLQVVAPADALHAPREPLAVAVFGLE